MVKNSKIYPMYTDIAPNRSNNGCKPYLSAVIDMDEDNTYEMVISCGKYSTDKPADMLYKLTEEGFKIINNITWQKTNPPPNLACRCFTHSTETVLWAQKADKKAKHFFNYPLMKSQNGGKQMKDVWAGPLTPAKEKTEGKHPTQKPLYLLTRIIEASTVEGAIILDPFCGSSTTGIAAKQLGRKYIGIDREEEYLQLSIRRFQREDTIK